MTTINLKDTVRGALPTSGTNGLFRLNYFDGRFLTAESLRKEQKFWDHRAQLVARIFPAGIAWGLGLRFPAGYPYPKYNEEGRGRDTGGADPTLVMTLEPGLAFTGIGRPIVVGSEFQFRFIDLMSGPSAAPAVVIDGGTQFAPCVCLAPSKTTQSGPGSTFAPGPYLLLIQHTETPHGEAKVYGNVCTSSTSPTLCEADGWQGGFTLSLASFPVNVPLNTITSAWDLRGLLAAYYFDVYEHALLQRWLSPFPKADPKHSASPDFCAGLGPFDRQDGPIPLAMVYIGSDQSVLFVDPWIPRRPLASSASTAWEANLRGAMAPSAVMARVHQFQCALDESLQTQDFTSDGNGGLRNQLNLYRRGFRRIPPWGFLPVPPTNADATGLDTVDVVAAGRFAESYFRGTNVITYTVVAVHDDDIFEDMARAAEKDAVELSICNMDIPPLDPATFLSSAGEPLGRLYGGDLTHVKLAYAAFAQLYYWLLGHCGGVSMARLANRQVEIVKLVVPLQGLQRTDPITGALSVVPGVAAQSAAFARIAARTPVNRFQPGLNFLPLAPTQPRPFVFYVKQRLVLLDVVYLLVDAMIDLVGAVSRTFEKGSQTMADADITTLKNSFVTISRRDPGGTTINTTDLRTLQQSANTKAGTYAAALLTDANASASLLGVLQAAAPELFRPITWKLYGSLQTALTKAGDPHPQDRAIDIMLREHRGGAALKLAAITLPSSVSQNLTTNAFEQLLQQHLVEGSASPADTYIIEPQARQPLGQLAQAVFDAARTAYGAQRLAVFTKGPPYQPLISLASIAVTPDSPSVLLGGSQQMTATGNYSDGSTRNLTVSGTWSSGDARIASISNTSGSNGLAQGVGVGQTTVAASFEGISGSTNFTVVPALVSIAVTPVNPTMRIGVNQQMTATGTYSDNSTRDLTASATWSSSNTKIVTFGSNGLAQAVSPGGVTVTASFGGKSGSTNITVAQPVTLVSITVTPADSAIQTSRTQQMTATGHYSDNTTHDLTTAATWTSSNVQVVTFITPPGMALGVAAGTSQVSATFDGKTGTTALTVNLLIQVPRVAVADTVVPVASGAPPASATPAAAPEAEAAVITTVPTLDRVEEGIAAPIRVWRDLVIDEVLEMSEAGLEDLLGSTMTAPVLTRLRTDLAELFSASRLLGQHDQSGQPDPAFWTAFWQNVKVTWASDGSATLTPKAGTTTATDLPSLNVCIMLRNISLAAGGRGFDLVAAVLGRP